ncbi:MAG: hypothetical protein PVI06_13870 [Desulfobacterales bacterium]|jgi:HEAT repeat protein
MEKARMVHILKKLQGGDRRSIGRVRDVVREVLEEPALFQTIFNAMLADDDVVRMRAADAVEKITAIHPHYLQPYKNKLIKQIAAIHQKEVRWHVAQILPRLALNRREHDRVVEILFGYLDDTSKIVKTFALQALADLAGDDERLRLRVIAVLEEMVPTGSPAVKSRGEKLLNRLKAN